MILNYIEVHEVLEDVKQELNSKNSHLLRDIKPTGDNIMVTCPYHNEGMENKPSMGITVDEVRSPDGRKFEKGTCHCFTCGATAPLVELISFVFGKEDGGLYGLKWLTRTYSIHSEVTRKPIQIGVSNKEEEFVINYIPKEFYVPYTQNKHPYLINRGISQVIMNYFSVGYDEENRNMIFPVMDKDGECLMIQRRSVDTKWFNNDDVPYKGITLYGYDKVVEQLRADSQLDTSELYVVESAIDALYLWTYGKAAVATLQARPTKEQIALLKRIPIRTIVAAQDTDIYGYLGAVNLRDKLSGSKLVKRVDFPEYNDVTGKAIKDINDLSSLQIQSLRSTIVFVRPIEKEEQYE